MKNLMFLMFASLMILTTSCDEDISVNFTSVDVKNQNNEVSIGENLEVEVKVNDDDGVQSVQIKIPALAENVMIDEFSGDQKWELLESFEVSSSAVAGEYEVIVTVTDMIGEVYVEMEGFTVQ